VIAVGGLGVTLAFTVVGDQRQAVADPIQAGIDQANRITQAGGALLATGLALVAVGGVLFTRSRARPRTTARVHVTPAWGGLVVSGRF
jgi:hypothetical protein